MIFNTPWFLWFFVAFYPLLLLLPGGRLRFWYVLAASAVFQGHFAGPAGVAPVVAMGVVVFGIAFKLHAAQGAARKRWLWLGLAVPVLGLLYYKYRVFLLGNVLALAPGLSPWLKPLMGDGTLFLPLAISFFTFEFVHYLTDVYKGQQPIRNPAMFALFCIYFPSIVSGPIKRYEEFCGQLKDGYPQPIRSGLALQGLAQVILGFFKKLVIADTAAQMIALMDGRDAWGPWPVLILLALLMVRILFDFSGYSDIAIGLSRMMGVELPANFNFPYLALNPSDFWRRWHMSLSTWIRDYLYIPLGGSRQGALRKGLNAFLAMAICGLWHGAAWNFAVWGLYHGLGLAVHGAWSKAWPAAEQRGLPARLLSWAACMVFVAYGWLLFFYPLDQAWRLTQALFGVN